LSYVENKAGAFLFYFFNAKIKPVTMVYLLIFYFLLYTLLAVKNIRYAIYWLIFSLPAYQVRFDVFSLPMTLLEGEILLLFIVWLAGSLKNKTFKLPSKNTILYFSILIFLLAATVSVFISPDLKAAAGIWKAYFIEPILFLIVFVSSFKKENLKDIFHILATQSLLLSLFAIYQKITGAFITNPFWTDEATRRVTGPFSYPNALALYLAPLIILLFGHLTLNFKNKISTIFYSAVILFSNLAVYFTGSKGALLAILVGIIFYALFFIGHRKKFIWLLIIILLLTGFYIFTKGLPDLNGTASVEGGDSVSTRLDMWSETWQMLQNNFLFGAGLAGYQSAVAPYHAKDYIEVYLYPHNIIFNFWSETGLIGLLAFILIIICFYKTGFKKTNRENYSLHVIAMSAMTTLLIHGLVDVPYFKNDLAILFWFIIGIILILEKNNIYIKKYE